jgi:DNA polymerase III subunit delta
MLPYSTFSRAKVVPKSGPHRVYGTLGDAYLQSSVISSLLEWILPDDARDFNLDILDGEDATINDALSRGGNLPFLADYRVVIVHRAERMDGLNRGGEDAAPKGKVSPAKRLGEGVANLPATTVLILSRTPETPESGARRETPRCINGTVDKALEQHGLLIDCTIGAKSGSTVAAVINNEAARRGIPLDRAAAEHLVARAGHDITNLLSELEKCALRVEPGEMVTSAVIDEMVKRAPQETVFDLTDALGQRETARAIGMLRELIGGGEAPELVLAMLVRHLRQLLQARAFMDARLPLDGSLASRMPRSLADQLPRDGRENLANLLQLQAWLGRRLVQQARNFSTPQLAAALQAALATDLAMKGIEGDGGSSELLLELFVAQLC